MRVAVIDMVANCRNESFNMPSVLKEMVIHLFRQNQQAYLERLTKIESEWSSAPDLCNKLVTPALETSKSTWLLLRRRLDEAIASVKDKENIATQLYQSLSEAYIGRPVEKVEVEPGRGATTSEIFIPDDDDDEVVAIEAYSSEDDDDDIQILEDETPVVQNSNVKEPSKETPSQPSTSNAS